MNNCIGQMVKMTKRSEINHYNLMRLRGKVPQTPRGVFPIGSIKTDKLFNDRKRKFKFYQVFNQFDFDKRVFFSIVFTRTRLLFHVEFSGQVLYERRCFPVLKFSEIES